MYSKLLHWKVSWLNLRLTSRFLYFLPTNAFTYIVETMSGIIKRGHKKDQRNFYSLSHVPKQIMMALKREKYSWEQAVYVCAIPTCKQSPVEVGNIETCSDVKVTHSIILLRSVRPVTHAM